MLLQMAKRRRWCKSEKEGLRHHVTTAREAGDSLAGARVTRSASSRQHATTTTATTK
jgi:hypothetical protein